MNINYGQLRKLRKQVAKERRLRDGLSDSDRWSIQSLHSLSSPNSPLDYENSKILKRYYCNGWPDKDCFKKYSQINAARAAFDAYRRKRDFKKYFKAFLPKEVFETAKAFGFEVKIVLRRIKEKKK